MSAAPPRYVVRRIYSALLALFGLLLAVPGGYLAAIGGSVYYVVAGIGLIVVAIMLWRGQRAGLGLYAVVTALTIVWTIWECGPNGWAMVPRLGALLIVGVLLLLPWVRDGLVQSRIIILERVAGWHGAALLLVGSIALGAAFYAAGPSEPRDPIYQAGTTTFHAGSALRPPEPAASGDWQAIGNDAGGTRFSELSQITPANVQNLKVAWIAHTGVAQRAFNGGMEATPLKVGATLFVCTDDNDVLAIDADTGAIRWSFVSGIDRTSRPYGHCRGVAYYRVPAPADPTAPCVERIITNTIDARLIALDARTGRKCPGFGTNGETSLLTGMGRVDTGYYFVSSAPTIVRGKIVLGGWVTDGQYWGEPSGVIRAFDAVTGRFAWAFDMGHPDQHGEPAPGRTYTHSTPNSWGPMSADETLGLVYAPTGSPASDYYGAQRRPFDDKYGSSVVALDATTGDVRWSFQTVHHDLWDYDVAAQPVLVDIPSPSGVQHALIQPTKHGEIFLLDRSNGRPLAPVQERPVPQGGTAAGERLSPTQPFSVGMPSFGSAVLRERDMWGATPFDQMWCRIKFREARYDGPMTPPGLRPTINFPGYLGGINWASVAVDRDRNVMIVNANRVGNYNRLMTRAEANARGIYPLREGSKGDVGGAVAQANTPFGADIRPFLSPLGIPCNEPPFGIIAAVDLTSHKLIWTKPLGTAQDSGPWGVPSMLPITIGVPNVGGALTTRSGLVFIGATQERNFRALDIRTGKELWSVRLPAGGQASPMSYWSDRSKRQFVVIAAGGSATLGSKMGDAIVAYALPK